MISNLKPFHDAVTYVSDEEYSSTGYYNHNIVWSYYGCKFKNYTGFVFSIWKDSDDRLMTFRDKEILCEYINLGQLDLQLKQLLIANKLKNIEQDFK